jgi:ferritin-like metal-binding protein YciE
LLGSFDITGGDRKAVRGDLAAGLTAHLEETNKQIERPDKVFEKLASVR